MVGTDGTVNTKFRFIAETGKAVGRMQRDAKKITNSLRGVNKQSGQTRKGIGRLGGGMVSTAFQFGFAAAITGAAFNQLRQIIQQTVTEGATGIDKMTRAILQSGVKVGDSTAGNIAKFKQFRDFILDMGTGRTIFGIDAVADAVKEVGKAVQNPANTIPIATEALKLMTIEEVNAATAAQGLVKIFKIYKDEITDIEEVTDVLVAVNQQSSITLDQLIRSFKFAAQAGKTFGLSMDETGAFLGVLNEQVGTAGGGPGRAFRALLSELTNSGTLLNKTLKGLGVNLVDEKGQFRDLVDIAREYRTALNEAGNNDVLKSQILELAKAGRQGEAALLALVNTTDEDLKNALAGAKTRGIADELADAFGKTPKAAIDKLKNAIGGLKVAFVAGLAPALNVLSGSMQALIRDVGVQEFFVEIGQIMGQEVIPLVKQLALSFRGLINFIGKNKVALQGLVKVFVAFTGALFVISMIAALGTVVAIAAKAFQFLAASVNLTSVALLRLFAVGLLLIGTFLFFKKAIGEIQKPLEEMDGWAIAAASALGVLAATAAGFLVGGPPGAVIGFLGSLIAVLGGLTAEGGFKKIISWLDELDAAAQKEGFSGVLEQWVDQIPLVGEAFRVLRTLLEDFDLIGLIFRDFGPEAAGQAAGEAVKNFIKGLDDALVAFFGEGGFIMMWWNGIDWPQFGDLGANAFNNFLFGMLQSITGIKQWIGKLIVNILQGNWEEVGTMIWDDLLKGFLKGIDGIAIAINDALAGLFSGGDPIAEFFSGFGQGFTGETETLSDLKEQREAFREQLERNTEQRELESSDLFIQHEAYVKFIREQTGLVDRFKKFQGIVDDTIEVGQETIIVEQDNIDAIHAKIIEINRLKDLLPVAGTAVDGMSSAITQLIKDIQDLQRRIRGARVFIPSSGSSSSSGGGAVHDPNRSAKALAFAHGGIVTKPVTAVVGDVPGGEAIIPLRRLPEIIAQSLKGSGTGGNITINASISIDNSSGKLSTDDIKNAVVDGLAKDLPKKIFLSSTI